MFPSFSHHFIIILPSYSHNFMIHHHIPIYSHQLPINFPVQTPLPLPGATKTTVHVRMAGGDSSTRRGLPGLVLGPRCPMSDGVDYEC